MLSEDHGREPGRTVSKDTKGQSAQAAASIRDSVDMICGIIWILRSPGINERIIKPQV